MSSANAANTANYAAVQQVVDRARGGTPLDVFFQQFDQLAIQTILQDLLMGLANGINPRELARTLANELDDLSYGRAEVIARTETLTAWNDAALENYRANSDVVAGWMWMCMPGAGTCVSCLEEDGQVFELGEELDDHPNGRCCKAPVTNDYGSILDEYGIPWEEGDFGPGPWDDRETGQDWLYAQNAATQRQAFGSYAAFNAWKVGDAQLEDFVKIRHDAVWGDSIQQQSLRGMGLDARDYGVGTAKEAAALEADLVAAERRMQFTMPYEGEVEVVRDNAVTARVLHDLFGRDLTDNEIAGLAGAVPGSEVRYGRAGVLEVYGPDNASKAEVRIVAREDGQLYIYNYVFRAGLADDAPLISQDVRSLEIQAQAARDHGIPNLFYKANHAGDDWIEMARMGYSAPIDQHLLEEIVGKAIPDEFKDARTLGDILEMKGGAQWWAEHGITPGLEFDTRYGSQSMQFLSRLEAESAEAAEAAEAAAVRAAEREAESAIQVLTREEANQVIKDASFSVERMDAEQLASESQRVIDNIQHVENSSYLEQASDLKARVSADLGTRLADNPEFLKISENYARDFEKQLRAKGVSDEAQLAEARATVPRTPEGIANSLLRSWASANDNAFPALQQAIRDEFGLKDALRMPGTKATREALAEWADAQTGLRAFVREMYNSTQDWLKANDIAEVPVYRGMGWEKLPRGMDASLFNGEVREIEVSLRAASSFSADADIASLFSNAPVTADEFTNYTQIIAARVPSELILSTPQTGFGALNESEVVMLGGKFDAVTVGAQISTGATITEDQALALLTRTEAEATAERAAVREADAAIAEATGRATTHIAERDVAEWTANNAEGVPSIGYHAGTPEHIARLNAEGIDVTRNLEGMFGRGFYMHTEYDPTQRFGSEYVRVAIHMEKPFVIADSQQYGELAAKYIENGGFDGWEDRMRADLLAQGYDGIIVRAQGFNTFNAEVRDEIVAIKPGTVRVIDDVPAAADMAAREAAQATGEQVTREVTGDTLRAEAQQMKALIDPVGYMNTGAEEFYASEAAHYEAKATVLADNPAWQSYVKEQRLVSVEDEFGHVLTPDMQAVRDIESAWNDTPLDKYPMNVALRQLSQDMFTLDGLPARTLDPAVQTAADQLIRESGDALRAYLQATYDETQKWFEERGISEVTLYRVVGKPSAIEGLPYDGRAVQRAVSGSALTSYSADPSHVGIFAELGEYRSMIAVRVPVSDVFGSPFTSMAHQGESEFIVFGSPQEAAIVSWKGAEAPTLDAALDRLATALPSDVATAGEQTAFAASRAEVNLTMATASYDLTAADRAFVADLKQQIEALDQTALTHDDAIQLGAQLHDRIQDSLTEFHDNALAAKLVIDAPYAELSPEQIAWLQGDPEQMAAHNGLGVYEAQAQYQAEFQARVLTYLQETRSMGEDFLQFNFDAYGAGSERAQMLRSDVAMARKMVPTDWIQASNDQGQLIVQLNRERSSGGLYTQAILSGLGKRDATIALADDMSEQAIKSSALHELMHRMENAVPQIGELEKAFYESRTLGDAVVELRNGIDAATKLDSWADEYIGRLPITFSNGTQSYEILSMGAEMLMGGGPTYDLLAMRADEEYVNFVLGILTSVHAPEILR